MTKLAEVNARSLAAGVSLACETMQRVFDADDGETPFFLAEAWPKAELGFFGYFSEAHVPGRHLNALLRAEAGLGMEVAESAIERHAAVLKRTLSGSVALPLGRREQGGARNLFLPHNCRETLYGLYALIVYRGDREAAAALEQMLAAIAEYWDPARRWDHERLAAEHGVDFFDEIPSVVWGLGRSVGPLVELHRVTGLDPALALARSVVAKLRRESFPADGSWAVERTVSHIHSVTSTLSGLALFAEHTQDAGLMEQVYRFYRGGLRRLRDALGWSPESVRSKRDGLDMGEANNTGDILETALTLGRWGYREGFDDAELILRGHLLPSQLRDVSFIAAPDNPEGVDGRRDVAARLRGAWGFPAPYGHLPVGQQSISFHLDVVGGATSSLTKAYDHVIRRLPRASDGRAAAEAKRDGDEVGLRRVELLFDHEAAGLEVRSPYGGGVLKLRVREPGPVEVRIPPWAPVAAIEVNGEPREPREGYVRLPNPPVGQWVEVRFPLPERTLVLGHRTHDIRVRLRGDEVMAMENFGANLTFFDPWE